MFCCKVSEYFWNGKGNGGDSLCLSYRGALWQINLPSSQDRAKRPMYRDFEVWEDDGRMRLFILPCLNPFTLRLSSPVLGGWEDDLSKKAKVSIQTTTRS